MIERGSQGREDDSVYGYVNENGNVGHPGPQSGGQGEFYGLAHLQRPAYSMSIRPLELPPPSPRISACSR